MKRASIALLGAAAILVPFVAGAQTIGQQNIQLHDNFTVTADLPPDPQPGECYARVFVPPKTRQVAKRVLSEEGGDELVVRPAEYRWTMRTIEVEAESERMELIPARFEMQNRTIVIEPAREEVKVIPAEYKTVEERVVVREAYQTWRRGDGLIQDFDRATGEVLGFVTVPAEYEVMKRRVLERPATVERRQIPAKTETVKVRVMVEPPRVRRIKVPAVTKQIRVQEEVRPMRITRRPVAAKYETVLETVKLDEGRVEWLPILCELNAEPAIVRDIQRALARRGYNPGPIDGVLGRGTMRAVSAYQRDNGLARDFLTIETIEALGIDPRS